MDDLVRWLRVQLDEDERIAREAARQRGGGTWKAERDAREILEIVGEQPHPGAYIPVILQPDDDETTVHIAEWDPARVLREIEAKRQALDHYEECARSGKGGVAAYRMAAGAVAMQIAIMALPYADRPGYQESWRP